VVAKLRKLKMPVHDEPDIVIQNIVATTNLESTLNLIQIAMSLGFENVEYEPEAFPGLVYRMADPKVVLLLFGSGKMVCVGAREVNDIKNAVRNIKHELRTAGLLRED
jgi:transcription initiation factor TFIID TATA-box-binding protein